MLLWPQVLQHFEAITPAPRDEVVHKKWAVPQRHSTICAPDPVGSERQTTMSVGFLLHDSADQYIGFVLRVCLCFPVCADLVLPSWSLLTQLLSSPTTSIYSIPPCTVPYLLPTWVASYSMSACTVCYSMPAHELHLMQCPLVPLQPPLSRTLHMQRRRSTITLF